MIKSFEVDSSSVYLILVIQTLLNEYKTVFFLFFITNRWLLRYFTSHLQMWNTLKYSKSSFVSWSLRLKPTRASDFKKALRLTLWASHQKNECAFLREPAWCYSDETDNTKATFQQFNITCSRGRQLIRSQHIPL